MYNCVFDPLIWFIYSVIGEDQKEGSICPSALITQNSLNFLKVILSFHPQIFNATEVTVSRNGLLTVRYFDANMWVENKNTQQI